MARPRDHRPRELPSVALLLAACQANAEPETVVVGDVAFRPVRIHVGAAAVAAGDLDGDGHVDLVGGGEPRLVLFRGDGTGALVRSGDVAGGRQPTDFALADLDGDGDVDLAIANHETDHLTLLLGDGRGAFEPAPSSPLAIDVRPHPHAVVAADLDRDGHVDLLVDHRDAGGVRVLRGTGGGRFARGAVVDVGGDPYRGMALGDLDGDGRLDLVTPNPRAVGVLLNASDEDGIAFTPLATVDADAPFAVALADLDGDGRLDLVAASEGSALVEVFLGDGRGGFRAAEGPPLHSAPGG
jgi:hypothetical protein